MKRNGRDEGVGSSTGQSAGGPGRGARGGDGAERRGRAEKSAAENPAPHTQPKKEKKDPKAEDSEEPAAAAATIPRAEKEAEDTEEPGPSRGRVGLKGRLAKMGAKATAALRDGPAKVAKAVRDGSVEAVKRLRRSLSPVEDGTLPPPPPAEEVTELDQAMEALDILPKGRLVRPPPPRSLTPRQAANIVHVLEECWEAVGAVVAEEAQWALLVYSKGPRPLKGSTVGVVQAGESEVTHLRVASCHRAQLEAPGEAVKDLASTLREPQRMVLFLRMGGAAEAGRGVEAASETAVFCLWQEQRHWEAFVRQLLNRYPAFENKDFVKVDDLHQVDLAKACLSL